jgi:hypothetical protein
MHFSGSSSPSNKQSFKGILTDVALLNGRKVSGHVSLEGPTIKSNLLNYLAAVGCKWNTKGWFKNYEHLTYLSDKLFELDKLPLKKVMSNASGLSQLSLKEEAAGKIRVFALVDSVTQSALLPLHKALFTILENVPNDGTFDQESSARRCVEKANLYNCAYSFDLTAATDRLPVKLTGAILTNIFGLPLLGEA